MSTDRDFRFEMLRFAMTFAGNATDGLALAERMLQFVEDTQPPQVAELKERRKAKPRYAMRGDEIGKAVRLLDAGYTVGQVAEEIGRTPGLIYKALRDGRLKATRFQIADYAPRLNGHAA